MIGQNCFLIGQAVRSGVKCGSAWGAFGQVVRQPDPDKQIDKERDHMQISVPQMDIISTRHFWMTQVHLDGWVLRGTVDMDDMGRVDWVGR